MSGNTAIVFGPTGRVGSACAHAARERGATVILAMRNPQKAVPGQHQGTTEGVAFEKIVQADLTQPDTVRAALAGTGATRAFIYMVFGTPDNMRSTLTALKSAGIEFVVFLSSDSIKGDVRSVPPSEPIAWTHAQVEINLAQIFGSEGFVAVRPTYFASNAFFWKSTIINDGEVRTAYPDAEFDWISPADIGRVCGSLLAGTAGGTHEIVRVSGPGILSQRDAASAIGTVLGKNIKVVQLDEEQGVAAWVKNNGMPELIAKHLVDVLRLRSLGEGSDRFSGPLYEEAVSNIRKYSGREPTNFPAWVEENKHEFHT